MFNPNLQNNISLGPFQYARTTNGGRVILYNNYTFRRKKVHKSNSYWICTKNKSLKCSVQVTTCGNFVTKVTRNHAHPPPKLDVDFRFSNDDSVINYNWN